MTCHMVFPVLQSQSWHPSRKREGKTLVIEPEPPRWWAGNTQPWILVQTQVIIGEAHYPRHGQESCHSLPGQHVQLKTWLSKGLGTVHVGSLQLSLKAELIQEGAAEGRDEQGTRQPSLYIAGCPFLYRMHSGRCR